MASRWTRSARGGGARTVREIAFTPTDRSAPTSSDPGRVTPRFGRIRRARRPQRRIGIVPPVDHDSLRAYNTWSGPGANTPCSSRPPSRPRGSGDAGQSPRNIRRGWIDRERRRRRRLGRWAARRCGIAAKGDARPSGRWYSSAHVRNRAAGKPLFTDHPACRATRSWRRSTST